MQGLDYKLSEPEPSLPICRIFCQIRDFSELLLTYFFLLSRASVLYFILNDLHKINPIYQFSLKAFSVVFNVAIERAEMADDVKTRVGFLTECITYNVFMYTTRGLFECDKLIFTAQMAFQILIMKKEVNPVELDFLLRFISYFSLFIPILWDINGFFSGPV